MSQSSDRVAVRALIHGRVQGVGFRFFVRDHANELGVRGWVRNVPGGQSVELVAEGPQLEIETLLSRVEQGPAGAAVDRVETEWITPQEQLQRFEIRR